MKAHSECTNEWRTVLNSLERLAAVRDQVAREMRPTDNVWTDMWELLRKDAEEAVAAYVAARRG